MPHFTNMQSTLNHGGDKWSPRTHHDLLDHPVTEAFVSKIHSGDKLFAPIVSDTLVDRVAPVEAENTLSKRSGPSSKASTQIDSGMIQRAVLRNLRSLLDGQRDASDSNSSVKKRSGAYSSSTTISVSKIKETLHFAAIKEQMLLDISKIMISNAEHLELVDVTDSSVISLNNKSFEDSSISNLDVIDEEEMDADAVGYHSKTVEKNDSTNGSEGGNRTSCSKSHFAEFSGRSNKSLSEKLVRSMRENFIHKLRLSFSQVNMSKDDDDTLVTATTSSETYIGYSSSESTSSPRTRTNSDITVVEDVPQLCVEQDHDHIDESQPRVSSSIVEDEASSTCSSKHRFEDLYEHGKHVIYRNRQLDLLRRLEEAKRASLFEMRWRKKHAAWRSTLKVKSTDQVFNRLYKAGSHKRNVEGKKLRNDIAKKSSMRDMERKNNFHF